MTYEAAHCCAQPKNPLIIKHFLTYVAHIIIFNSNTCWTHILNVSLSFACFTNYSRTVGTGGVVATITENIIRNITTFRLKLR